MRVLRVRQEAQRQRFSRAVIQRLGIPTLGLACVPASGNPTLGFLLGLARVPASGNPTLGFV